jgi:proteasome lid subunit RPN8/RPN11
MYPVVRRSLRDRNRDDKVDINSPVKCAEYLQPSFIGRKTECLLVAFLDVDCRVINTQWIEGAHPSHLKIDVSGIAKLALKNGASYALIAHNHPSGNLAPSKEDISETSKLFASLMSVDIRLVDSFVFSDSGFLSFRNNGLMASMESEWFRHKTSKTNLQNPQHYNLIYTSDLAEFLLDFSKLRDKATLETITKEEYLERLKAENDKKHE